MRKGIRPLSGFLADKVKARERESRARAAAGLLVRQDASAAESEVTAGILKDARLRMKEE
jgi:hypothetical protein